MAKPHVIFIHGMGEHEKEKFLKGFYTPLNQAASHFASMKPLSGTIEAHFIDYNAVIKGVRNFMKSATISEMRDRYPGAPSVIAMINKLNRKFGEDDSFWFTHILDVVIYRSIYSNAIQARVGMELVKAMQKAVDAKEDVHIVCHSLGCAVGHDVLHKLYTNSLHDNKGKLLLYAGLNKIRSINMIANVCCLPITEVDPYQSVVKPGPSGICDYFMSCRHVLDPFASIAKFKPESSWSLVQGGVFKNKIINRVGRANVHDMDHYFSDPLVYIPFFMSLFPVKYKTTSNELKRARQTHEESTIQGKFEALKTHMEDAEITLYWDAMEGEFIFSDDAETMFEKLSAFLEHLELIKDAISNLK